jgi:cell division protein FtsB
MKNTSLTILAFALVALVGYGSWLLERKIHYKWSYQAMVQAEIQKQIVPLQEQINALDARVKKLENK